MFSFSPSLYFHGATKIPLVYFDLHFLLVLLFASLSLSLSLRTFSWRSSSFSFVRLHPSIQYSIERGFLRLLPSSSRSFFYSCTFSYFYPLTHSFRVSLIVTFKFQLVCCKTSKEDLPWQVWCLSLFCLFVRLCMFSLSLSLSLPFYLPLCLHHLLARRGCINFKSRKFCKMGHERKVKSRKRKRKRKERERDELLWFI